VIAIAVLSLGLTGIALAGVTGGSSVSAGSQVNVAVLDGKLIVSSTTIPAGTVTLVVVNQGKKAHGLAIMGSGLSAKRTPSIAAGKSAKLTVTLKAGNYHVWDPVQSSMSHAKMLTVKSSSSTSSGGGGSSSGGKVVTGTAGGGSKSTSGTDTAGMEACDHM
jgi:hypothetical protein